MKFKNKIIKWLGGYTKEEFLQKKIERSVENQKITFTRTEKQLFPITVQFAVMTLDQLDYIKNNLCYQVANFMFNYNLLHYNVTRDEENDCYIVHGKAYVVEP